ncbi:hypothetical protein N8Z82_00890 [Pelagibacteraceae bacterium]|nr:hypothetical protein [Pelagibacteraceae bacterium]
MKKLLGIIVLGLLLSGNAFAEVIDFKCKRGSWNYNWSLDLSNEIVRGYQYDKGKVLNHSYTTKAIDKEKIVVRSDEFKNTFTWYYSSDQRVTSPSESKPTDWNCSYNTNLLQNEINKKFGTSNNSESTGISFTIKDKKEQCAVIGFKPETDKFADCVLRLVELDVKKQQSNKIANAQNSGNEALVKQLQRQEYDRGTDALLNLGQQLLQPKSSSYSTCSYIDLGSGMSKVKCN